MLDKNQDNRISWEEIFAHPKISIREDNLLEVPQVYSNRASSLDHMKSSLMVMKASLVTGQPIEQISPLRDEISGMTHELIKFEDEYLKAQELERVASLVYNSKVICLCIDHMLYLIKRQLLTCDYPKIVWKFGEIIEESRHFQYQAITSLMEKLEKEYKTEGASLLQHL